MKICLFFWDRKCQGVHEGLHGLGGLGLVRMFRVNQEFAILGSGVWQGMYGSNPLSLTNHFPQTPGMM